MKIAMILRLVDAGIKIARMLLSHRGQLGAAATAQLKRMKRLYRQENLRESERLDRDIEAELARRSERK